MNVLFNKVLGENEKCVFYLYLKPNELFGQPNIKFCNLFTCNTQHTPFHVRISVFTSFFWEYAE